MPYYAVTYEYSATETQLAEVRAEHRDYLKGLNELRLSGPFVGGSAGALLIFQAEDDTRVDEIVARDPFFTAGFIGSWNARQWNPASGPLAGLL